MAKHNTYAERFSWEKTPVVDGQQYRSEKVKLVDTNCDGCAAWSNGIQNKELCNALPPCTKGNRLDGENVRYVDCGKAVKK